MMLNWSGRSLEKLLCEDEGHKSHTIGKLKLVVGDSYGIPDFITHPELAYNRAKNTKYLKNDTLYFRVSVEVKGHKPWLECIVK